MLNTKDMCLKITLLYFEEGTFLEEVVPTVMLNTTICVFFLTKSHEPHAKILSNQEIVKGNSRNTCTQRGTSLLGKC